MSGWTSSDGCAWIVSDGVVGCVFCTGVSGGVGGIGATGMTNAVLGMLASVAMSCCVSVGGVGSLICSMRSCWSRKKLLCSSR